ncbi:hypothetical protein AB205_0067760, partial [Aquarana catesbeiana]
WIEDYEMSLVDVTKLQAEVEQYMQEYDKKVAEKEEEAKEEVEPDEDGWVTVTRKGRRPGLARTEAVSIRVAEKEKKKRAQKELLAFYAFQNRNSKKECRFSFLLQQSNVHMGIYFFVNNKILLNRKVQ